MTVLNLMGMGYKDGLMMGGNMEGAGILGLATWIALLAFLILGSIYFWKGINRKK